MEKLTRAWKGLYQERSKSATVLLEVVASADLWIWHAFFGTPGTCNEINVLQQSSVFDDIYQVFIPAIRMPMNPVDDLFTQRQESVRKDVERAFGVLQSRFAIIQRPALVWDGHLLWEIMLACIILHNMIVEDERDTYQNYHDMSEFEQENKTAISGSTRTNYSVQPGRFNGVGLDQYMERRADTWDKNVHNALQRDLTQHRSLAKLWPVYR
ncbi:uncharacterized protein [Spinacia oleracea]|uniref:DDE Tnp4 domain-containing protein n=1 Tax=Spinacia oleracea TaxID=3562 RepID=A0A9R0IM42_SPIOL|nr:uncharacterized protein LOC110791455 [Spinacia oleracea]